MAIVCDASSIILLAKASALETFTNRNAIYISPIVYMEVIKGKEKGRFDSLLAEKLVKNGNIKIQKLNNLVKKQIEDLFNIKKGGLETISLSYKTKNTVLTDDKKCLNVAKALDIGFITSLDVIIALMKKRAISKEKAKDCIEKLEQYGWYDKDLIKTYMEEIK